MLTVALCICSAGIGACIGFVALALCRMAADPEQSR